MNYSKIVLSGVYKETGRQVKGVLSAAGREGFRFDDFYIRTEVLKGKKNIKKILVICRQDFSAKVFGGLEEIRERLSELESSGKELWFFAPSYAAPQLYLASVCSRRIIHPMGGLRFSGLSLSFSFYRQLMRRLGIEAEVFRRGCYKSAGDRYRTDNIEQPNKEQYTRYIESVMNVLEDGIKSGFGKNDDDLNRLLDGKILLPDEAVEDGWIDRVVTEIELENEWKTEKDKEVKLKKHYNRTPKGFRFKERRIAVLVFEGAIIDGRSRRDPMLGQAVGSDSFVPQIKKLADDKKVKAVVLRINSGGGSAFASESITVELRRLAEKKPLVISMSEIAGSGGYWISCCGRKTFALPTTLTGSIGVISIYFSWYKLLKQLGITHDTIKTNEHADVGSPLRPLTAREREIIDAETGSLYERFVEMVSDFRGIERAELDQLAQGRIWSGADAVEKKLVEQSGGLASAVCFAADEAGVNNPVIRFYPEIRHNLVERLLANVSPDDDSTAELVQRGASINMFLSEVGDLSGSSCKSRAPSAVMEEVLGGWI